MTPAERMPQRTATTNEDDSEYLIREIPKALAQSLEGVLMPGKVITGHAKVEDQCVKCHIRFDKAAQDRLCLDCHKDVARDLRVALQRRDLRVG